MPEALGGYFSIASHPMWPFFTSDPDSVILYGSDSRTSDMNFFIFEGSEDQIFPEGTGYGEFAGATSTLYTNGYEAPNLRYYGVAEGIGHFEDCRYIAVMMDWIHFGTVSSIDDYEYCEKKWAWVDYEED